jgi:hypothetical protein
MLKSTERSFFVYNSFMKYAFASKSEKGFSVVELVLSFALLGAIGAAGYFAYISSISHSKASVATTSSPGVTPTNSANTSTHTTNDALSQIKKMYLALQNSNTVQGHRDTWKNYLSAQLNSQLVSKADTAQTDVLTCQQTFSPSYGYALKSSDSSVANITVTDNDNIPGSQNGTVTYGVTLNDLKVASTSCTTN